MGAVSLVGLRSDALNFLPKNFKHTTKAFAGITLSLQLVCNIHCITGNPCLYLKKITSITDPRSRFP